MRLATLGSIQENPVARGLDAQHHVLGDGHHRHEHEVLVHHADAARDGIVGGVDIHLFPADQDLAFIRLIQAVEDVHQGGLAGAVFPQQGMDLALLPA